MPAGYESPEVPSALTPDQIRLRYRDTSLVIFEEQQRQLQKIRESKRERASYLSFGNNRRVMTYSSNGNEPVVVRRNMTNAVERANGLYSQFFRVYRKPRDNCTIS